MTSTPPPTVSHAALRQWFGIAPDAMLAVDRQGTIVLANHRAEQMFGYAAGSLAGTQLEALLPSSMRKSHMRLRLDFQHRPRMRPMGIGLELVGARRDGTEFPLEIGLSPVTTEGGGVTIASVRDISETRRVRLALERAKLDAVLAQIGRLTLESPNEEIAIQATPALVAGVLGIPAVAVLSANRSGSACQISATQGVAAPTAQALTSLFSDAEVVHTVFRQRSRDVVTLKATHEPCLAQAHACLAAVGFHDAVMLPLPAQGRLLGALVALADGPDQFTPERLKFLQSVANLLAGAAQRRRGEEELAHARRLDAIGQLTGGIAHDLNNLLTVISGNLQLLETELSGNSEARDIIGDALRGVDRGADLTSKLLSFARRQALRPRVIVPQPLLIELGHMLRRTLGEAVEVRLECATAIPDVYADPGELETALVNLALNARDAMPHGGQLTIATHEVFIEHAPDGHNLRPGRYVAFDVADTGTGMSKDTLAHAFEPFFTTKGSGHGSGLGLSMVYGFVTQSGGNVTIDSQLGLGTRIRLLLPVALGSPGADRATGVHDAAEAPQRGSILIVEDKDHIRIIAERFLRAIGYEVLAAADARAALEIIGRQPAIDLLFTDVMLGSGMDGVTLAHAVRCLRPKIAVLLTSGQGKPSGTHPGRNLEPEFEFLPKPYQRSQLEKIIGRLVDQARCRI